MRQADLRADNLAKIGAVAAAAGIACCWVAQSSTTGSSSRAAAGRRRAAAAGSASGAARRHALAWRKKEAVCSALRQAAEAVAAEAAQVDAAGARAGSADGPPARGREEVPGGRPMAEAARPLFRAALCGDTEAVEALVESGADLRARSSRGRSLLAVLLRTPGVDDAAIPLLRRAGLTEDGSLAAPLAAATEDTSDETAAAAGPTLSEHFVNAIERATGIDVDRDGDIGEVGAWGDGATAVPGTAAYAAHRWLCAFELYDLVLVVNPSALFALAGRQRAAAALGSHATALLDAAELLGASARRPQPQQFVKSADLASLSTVLSFARDNT